ncbi:MAG: DUF2652 domain-containing protein [Cytophagales bacterium]|nr:DUF2652 domain-containing protein [Cytophagales bacterium]
MQNKGLLFIPDISGFTTFVNTTAIEHSQHIISELLSEILDANILNLKLSEIEGDAILFYKYGDPPTFDELYHQVEKIFVRFHQHLKTYEQNRICNCGACESAPSLTLKFITHYGEYTTYQVKDNFKLIGKSIITAHRLLKNTIPGNEYWLITEPLLSVAGNIAPNTLTLQPSVQQVDNADLQVHYCDLAVLRENIIAKPWTASSLNAPHTEVLNLNYILPHNMYSLLQIVTNLSIRSQWMEGVKSIEKSDHMINQLGNVHNCILANRCDIIQTTTFIKTDSSIEYGELIDGMGFLNFTFEQMNVSSTNVNIRLSIKKNFMNESDVFHHKKEE